MLQQEVIEEESRFTLYVDLPEGSTLEATDEVVRQVEAAAAKLEGVERYTASVQEGQGSVTVLLVKLEERPPELSAEILKDQLEEQLRDIEGGVVGDEPQARAGGGAVVCRSGREVRWAPRKNCSASRSLWSRTVSMRAS